MCVEKNVFVKLTRAWNHALSQDLFRFLFVKLSRVWFTPFVKLSKDLHPFLSFLCYAARFCGQGDFEGLTRIKAFVKPENNFKIIEFQLILFIILKYHNKL